MQFTMRPKCSRKCRPLSPRLPKHLGCHLHRLGLISPPLGIQRLSERLQGVRHRLLAVLKEMARVSPISRKVRPRSTSSGPPPSGLGKFLQGSSSRGVPILRVFVGRFRRRRIKILQRQVPALSTEASSVQHTRAPGKRPDP